MRPGPVVLMSALLAAACGQDSGGDGQLEPLPSMEQARSEAAAEIGPENADEQFERLKREIEADR